MALALLWRRLSVPHIPEGDSIVVYERGFSGLMALGPAFERADENLRQWPAAGVCLLAIVLALLAAGSG